MDIKFSKESQEADAAQEQPQKNGRQTGMLMLLLVLLGGFAYLYFFTDLIRKQPAPPPLPAPSVVKQPLPQRSVSSVSAATAPVPTAASTPQAAVPAAVPPVATAPAVQQQPAGTKPTVQPASKPVEKQPAAPPLPATKSGGDKPVVSQKVQPVAQHKAATSPMKTKSEPSKTGVAKTAVKAPTVAKQPVAKTTQPAKSGVAKPGGPWTVVVGVYVVEETLAADAAEVKKAGLNPLITSGPRRQVTMHRLFLGEYPDKQQALQAVEKLKTVGGNGFTLQKGDKVEVYAGSFAVTSGAQSEQQRLAAAGVTTSIRKTPVSLASRKLTAGTYTNRATADQAVKKLKGAGVGTPTLE